jgi:S1-C subfamily serine protease
MKTVMIIFAAALSHAGQNAPADPFIGAIENMKRSVAPLVCLDANGAHAKMLERAGTAFFVSGTGDFLTAAHVIVDMQNSQRQCSTPAITIPPENWRPDVRQEPLNWFPFKFSDCRIDLDLDVAACRLIDDPAARTPGFKIAPVKPARSISPDGTQVAFTGFPLGVRDPMTSKAIVAAYRTVWENDKAIAELVLDRAPWPGSSGSPVYLSDGRVIGIVIASGIGLTIVRPESLIWEMFAERAKR